jgi:hypothetical protein
MGFEFKEFSSSSTSNNSGRPKKWGTISKSEIRSENMKNTKDNTRKQHNTYQYKYSNKRKNNCNHHQKYKNIFNPQWSNNIYFRGLGD